MNLESVNHVSRKILLWKLEKDLKPLSTNPTKWSNTLKQFDGKWPFECVWPFCDSLGQTLPSFPLVITIQWRIQNPVKNLRWSIFWKSLTAKSRSLFWKSLHLIYLAGFEYASAIRTSPTKRRRYSNVSFNDNDYFTKFSNLVNVFYFTVPT